MSDYVSGSTHIEIHWQEHIRPGHFTWVCPKCGASSVSQLGDGPVGGWSAPIWVLTGDRENPTLEPSLGCFNCYPDGHYWCIDGILTDA